MNLYTPAFVRRLVLTTSALTFSTIGLLAVCAPQAVAKQYGFTLDHVDAFNEFRAVYVGFWLALGATMLTAARRVDLIVLGDLCALMLLLQASGRALSFVLDGYPSWPFVAAFFAELTGGATILLMRSTEATLAKSARAT
jgi:hypothetical protein